jgi:Tfp pilus assembly protein PilN
MKRLNLLPMEMVENDHAAWRSRGMLGACGAILALCWAGAATIQCRALDTRINAAERELEQARADQRARESIDQRCADLEAYVEAVDALRPRIPQRSVLALLSHLTPDSIIFDSLESSRTTPATRARTAQGATPSGPRVAVRIAGTATSDNELTTFIGRLTASPFTDRVHAETPRTSSSPGGAFKVSLDMLEPDGRIAEGATP